MRTIKFRCWHGKIGEMLYNPVITNYSWYEDAKHYEDDWSYKDDPKGKVLMQFTGLLDKNFKEIYESDWLGDYLVRWINGKYILHHISSGDIMNCDEGHTFDKEITGNFYEHPRKHPAL